MLVTKGEKSSIQAIVQLGSRVYFSSSWESESKKKEGKNVKK